MIPCFQIDCEGCEYAVIPSFTDEAWDKIVETHGEAEYAEFSIKKRCILYSK